MATIKGFTLHANNDMANKVEVDFPNLPNKTVTKRAVEIAIKAFRDIYVVNDDTGEVMYQIYIDDDVYTPTASTGVVIDELTILWMTNEIGGTKQ